MNDSLAGKVPWSHWLISGVTLIYNGAGVVNFISQMSAASVTALPESYRLVIESRPAWATIAFAVAVFGGLVGCVFLLMRKSVAYYMFGASLAGAIATMAHILGMSGPVEAPTGFIVGNLVQIAVTVFLIWYSKRSENKGWINRGAA
jgi:hypothetical protein